MKPPSNPQQSKSFMSFKRTEMHPANNTGTYSITAHLGHCSVLLPRPLSLPFAPKSHSLLCSLRDPIIIEPYPTAPMTSPSVTPLFSESQIRILIKSYKFPHDLPPWHLSLIPSHSPPLTPSAPATLVRAATQTHQAHFLAAAASF